MKNNLKKIIGLAVKEDRVEQDITTRMVVPDSARGSFGFYARENGVVCGLKVVKEIFSLAGCRFQAYSDDGELIKSGDKIARVSGKVQDILSRERIALNLLQHLSGIATTVYRLRKAAGYKAKIYDTRKTLPGLRQLEKYAVKCGGGFNHRWDLAEHFLIKDNHWRFIKDLTAVVRKMRHQYPAKLIEVECENQSQIDQAINAGVDIILLDNLSPPRLKKFIRYIRRKSPVKIEISGRVRFANIREIARLRPERISCGFITHSAGALDISLEYED